MTEPTWLGLLSYGDSGWGDEFLRGAWLTLTISLASYALGLALGLLGATAKLSPRRLPRAIAGFYTTVVRAVPELLLILLIYYTSTSAMSDLVVSLGLAREFQVNAFLAACLSLGTVQGAYSTEVIRGAILSVGKEQTEAALSLGLSRRQCWWLVIFPQMLQRAIPGLGNLWLVVLKESSLISVVGFSELLLTAKMAGGAENDYLFFFSMVALMYLALSTASGWVFESLERRASRHERVRA